MIGFKLYSDEFVNIKKNILIKREGESSNRETRSNMRLNCMSRDPCSPLETALLPNQKENTIRFCAGKDSILTACWIPVSDSNPP